MLFVWILINEYLLIVIDNENDYWIVIYNPISFKKNNVKSKFWGITLKCTYIFNK